MWEIVFILACGWVFVMVAWLYLQEGRLILDILAQTAEILSQAELDQIASKQYGYPCITRLGLWRLERRGEIEVEWRGNIKCWRITEVGRDALDRL